MNTLLVVNSSGRFTRSITRHLTACFGARWSERYPAGRIIQRDVAATPPPLVNEAWIAAAYSAPEKLTPELQKAIAESDRLIDEIQHADAVVIGSPMYNFGIPASLKAWIDQIVRVGRTFAFEADDPSPYRPLLQPKPTYVIVSAGDGDVHPGGALAHWNFLEPHLQRIFEFIGLTDLEFIRVGYDEFQDDRHTRSLNKAEAAVDEALEQLFSKSSAAQSAVLA